ncbi:MAG: tetratricopeptide repeat-containing sensor histidine kinase [Bacteroidota bacterium]
MLRFKILNFSFFKPISLLIGLFFISKYAYTQDQRVADSLIRVYKSSEYPDSVRRTILKKISFNHSDPDTSLFYANLIIESAEGEKDLIGKYIGFFSKGTAYRLKGVLDESLKSYLKSVSFAIELEDSLKIAQSYFALGDVYSSSGDHDNSIEYYNRAIYIFNRINNTIGLATSYLNAGLEYYSEGKWEKSFEYNHNSDSLFEVLNYEIGQAYAEGNIGLVYAKQGLLDSAEKKISRAIKILEEYEDRYAIADYEIQMADIYHLRGDIPRAIEYANGSYKVAMEDGLKEQVRDASIKLSELYGELDNYREAYFYQSKYLTYRDSINNEETIRKIADLRTEFEVAKKQVEVDLALKEKANNQTVAISLGIMVFVGGLLAFRLYRVNRKRNIANQKLSLQNAEIQSQKEEIQAQKEEIQATNEKLQVLNETKDRFFGIISHDLRSPVNAFKGLTELISMYVKEKNYDGIQEMMVHLDQSSNRLSFLLDNLLKWALSQQGSVPHKPEKISIGEITNEIFSIFKSKAHAKNIELKKNTNDEDCLMVDKNTMMTVFRNLVSNSLKFTNEGGVIEITSEKLNGTQILKVKDSGLGMSQEKLDILFDLGVKKTTSGTAGEKGTGLGMVLVKEFVEMNDGSIEVESEEGVGTTFKILLPDLC